MSPKQLLIVDDSPLIVSRLRNLLEGLPGLAAIDSAGTVAEALDRLSGAPPPDIVLLDINLPDDTGINLLRYLHLHHPGVVVIMQSNQGGVFYRNLCLQLGASYYIDKSSEFEYIPSILSSLLQGSL
jgi:DNA-binding NarL/FixJ family response regulator